MNNEKYINLPVEIEKELFAHFKKDEDLIIFDIGSCDGLDSIKYARMFPSSKIYAFEPLSKNVELIYSNLTTYSVSNIQVVPLALSDKKGQEKFYVSSGNPEELKSPDWDYGNKSSSLLPPDKSTEVLDWLKFDLVETVETNTLHAFCKENQIQLIDYIHIDVQGAELMVLDGASEFISRIKMIWMEVENIPLYKDQPLKTEVELYMHRNGFTKIKDTVNHISGDQLYVNLNFFPKKKLTNTIWRIYSKLLRK
jgi:FkbM family methyltransferase